MMSNDPLWQQLDKQRPEDVARRLAQGIYGKRNEASVRRWLEERGGDLAATAKKRAFRERVTWIIQMLLSG